MQINLQDIQNKFNLTPYQILVLAFVFLILVGACLLMLPISVNDGHTLSFIDALFTATSAVCVTGLVVVDTGTFFSTFGQIVIITLIQIGGFGVMTITTLFAVAMGRRIQLRSRIIVQESLNNQKVGGIVLLIIRLVEFTISIELIGGLILGIALFPTYGWKGFFYGMWHAISAFCNAGFDIFGGTTIYGFATNPVFVLVITSLIILGGLGFMVMVEVWNTRKWEAFSLHTKIVLYTTAFLVIVGTVVLLLLEWNNGKTIGNYDFIHKTLGAYFLSVTSRTAGFSLVNISSLHEASIFSIIILMFLGASPGSTGGGIKTTTIAVIFATVYSLIRGKDEVTLFNRRIEYNTIVKSLAIFYLAAALVVTVTMYLCISENFDFIKVLFEVVSAMATVGLSTGITSELTNYGKGVIILMMLIGRVGVFTFLLAIALRSKKKGKISYPTEKISVG